MPWLLPPVFPIPRCAVFQFLIPRRVLAFALTASSHRPLGLPTALLPPKLASKTLLGFDLLQFLCHVLPTEATLTLLHRILQYATFQVSGRVTSQVIAARNEWWWMKMMAKMIFGDLGCLKLPDICLTGEEKPRKNLTQETRPDRGSNPGPLRDKRACYHLLHGYFRFSIELSQSFTSSIGNF